jgi:hypothetical protein
MRIAALAAVLALLPQGQDPKPAATKPAAPAAAPAATPAADPKDVDSVASLMRAVYAVISGPAGQKRDWDRMRSLFLPEARLVPMVKAKDGVQARALTVTDYIQRAGPSLEQNGFFEQEISQHVDAFGDFAQVFSTYEGRKALSDATPFLRGINSFQLVHQGGRWWVLQILWEQEADAGPIPAQFLPQAKAK